MGKSNEKIGTIKILYQDRDKYSNRILVKDYTNGGEIVVKGV